MFAVKERCCLKIIGIGDNVVDKYVHQKVMYPGGNALNFSVFAKKLNVDAAYMGIFGDDEAAEHIKTVLDEIGVDYSYSVSFHGQNGFARVSLENGERVFLPGNSGGVSKDHPIIFNEDQLDYIRQFDLIHSSCYSYIESHLETLTTTKIPISFDFSDRLSEDYLREVSHFIHFGFLSCGDMTLDEVKRKLQTAVDAGCNFAVASRGGLGSVYFNGESLIEQEAFLVQPVDTMGAGDSFITGFLMDLLKQNALFTHDVKIIKGAMIFGSKKASETCMVNGTFGFGKSY